jgi:hypothetical protein
VAEPETPRDSVLRIEAAGHLPLMFAAAIMGHHFIDFGPLQCAEFLRGLLLTWKNLMPNVGESLTDCRVCQGIHGDGIERRA